MHHGIVISLILRNDTLSKKALYQCCHAQYDMAHLYLALSIDYFLSHVYATIQKITKAVTNGASIQLSQQSQF